MLDRVKDEITNAQAKIKEIQETVTEQADELVLQARHKAHIARGEGKQRLWTLENQALEWADDVIERAADVKGAERIRGSASRFVQDRRDIVQSLPIDGYADLNARAAANAVRELDWVGLLQIEQAERECKARKTVFDAIDRRQVQLEKPPFRDQKVA